MKAQSLVEASPARVVADADVLAAALLVGGTPRDALDMLRAHSWTTLVVSNPLLDDVEAIVASLATSKLASDWRAKLAEWADIVDHPDADHPALASAYHGGAMQLLSLDPSLTGVQTGVGLQDRLPVSIREPAAFCAVFSPERLYPVVVGGSYPGPDRDARW